MGGRGRGAANFVKASVELAPCSLIKPQPWVWERKLVCVCTWQVIAGWMALLCVCVCVCVWCVCVCVCGFRFTAESHVYVSADL